MGETSASGAAEELDECEDPLALLDPKEELLSETESLELDDEDEKSTLNVPISTDINHKHTTHTPTEPPPSTPPPKVSAATTTILPAITSNNNDGKF